MSSERPRSPLSAAIVENDIEKLKEALAATPPPTTDELGSAAFIVARRAEENSLLMIKLILDHDASVCGSLAHTACSHRDVELFQLMHDHGWGKDQINAFFIKPHWGLLSVALSANALRWLLDHGLDPNLPAERGMSGTIGDLTPLNAVASESWLSAEKAIESMEVLVSRGAVVDYEVLQNAVHVARNRTVQFHGEVLGWILQHATGFDINTPAPRGYPMLHLSIFHQRQALVEWLLENGADPSIRVKRVKKIKRKRMWLNAVQIAEEVGNEQILEKVRAAAEAQ